MDYYPIVFDLVPSQHRDTDIFLPGFRPAAEDH